MFFLNHQYFLDQTGFLSFEALLAKYRLAYFAPKVKIIVFFSHRWVDAEVADNGACFAECKGQVDQIIAGFEGQKEDLKHFGFFFDYSCIPQICGDRPFNQSDRVLPKLRRLLLIELYQTLTQSTTLYLCYSNSRKYHERLWIVMELVIALDKHIEQIPTQFRGDQDLTQLAIVAKSVPLFSGTADLAYFVREVTRNLECTFERDRTATQLTLYRYLKTRETKVPIELMNLAMWDVQIGLRHALDGNISRLERHIDNGLANWDSAIDDLGFDREFRRKFKEDLVGSK